VKIAGTRPAVFFGKDWILRRTSSAGSTFRRSPSWARSSLP